jgi:uncharacterized protein YdbL (DUF1318 family)
MRRVLPIKLLFAVLLVACVTVNVYFPAAAVEQAADQYINNVTGRSSTEPQGEKPGTEPPRTLNHIEPPPVLLAALGHALEMLVPAAQAQSPNIDASTPETRAIQGSMKARFPQLEKYLESGALGLTNDGLIAERDTSSVPIAERATVKRLVAEDNRDRATLYTELAKANGHPEWEADIRKVFAQRWVETGAKPGWYYQDSSGAWKQK